jgi:hypothetical protein
MLRRQRDNGGGGGAFGGGHAEAPHNGAKARRCCARRAPAVRRGSDRQPRAAAQAAPWGCRLDHASGARMKGVEIADGA